MHKKSETRSHAVNANDLVDKPHITHIRRRYKGVWLVDAFVCFHSIISGKGVIWTMRSSTGNSLSTEASVKPDNVVLVEDNVFEEKHAIDEKEDEQISLHSDDGASESRVSDDIPNAIYPFAWTYVDENAWYFETCDGQTYSRTHATSRWYMAKSDSWSEVRNGKALELETEYQHYYYLECRRTKNTKFKELFQDLHDYDGEENENESKERPHSINVCQRPEATRSLDLQPNLRKTVSSSLDIRRLASISQSMPNQCILNTRMSSWKTDSTTLEDKEIMTWKDNLLQELNKASNEDPRGVESVTTDHKEVNLENESNFDEEASKTKSRLSTEGMIQPNNYPGVSVAENKNVESKGATDVANIKEEIAALASGTCTDNKIITEESSLTYANAHFRPLASQNVEEKIKDHESLLSTDSERNTSIIMGGPNSTGEKQKLNDIRDQTTSPEIKTKIATGQTGVYKNSDLSYTEKSDTVDGKLLDQLNQSTTNPLIQLAQSNYETVSNVNVPAETSTDSDTESEKSDIKMSLKTYQNLKTSPKQSDTNELFSGSMAEQTFKKDCTIKDKNVSPRVKSNRESEEILNNNGDPMETTYSSEPETSSSEDLSDKESENDSSSHDSVGRMTSNKMITDTRTSDPETTSISSSDSSVSQKILKTYEYDLEEAQTTIPEDDMPGESSNVIKVTLST